MERDASLSNFHYDTSEIAQTKKPRKTVISRARAWRAGDLPTPPRGHRLGWGSRREASAYAAETDDFSKLRESLQEVTPAARRR
jgi:hypothetical protein